MLFPSASLATAKIALVEVEPIVVASAVAVIVTAWDPKKVAVLFANVTEVVLFVITAVPLVPSANMPISSTPPALHTNVTDLPVAVPLARPTLPIVVVTVIDSLEGSPAEVF